MLLFGVEEEVEGLQEGGGVDLKQMHTHCRISLKTTMTDLKINMTDMKITIMVLIMKERNSMPHLFILEGMFSYIYQFMTSWGKKIRLQYQKTGSIQTSVL